MTDTRRGSRTTPEAIAERTFSQVKRGYAEAEVRAYLRMVSNDVATRARRVSAIWRREFEELEAELRKPSLPPSDQELIAALGEETARVLGQARESAVELRNKAEEHARRVVREAQETARELRTTTQQAVEAKTREAEDAARARAKEIVGEARALRERVLADLETRRQELERQIGELRGGRGKLVETYELVERALAHAARVMSEEPSTPPEVPPAAPSDDATPDETQPAAEEPVAEAAPSDAPVDEAPSATDATTDTPGDTPTDVGALFEKLRSGRAEETAAAPTPEALAEPAPEPEPPAEVDAGAGDDGATLARDEALADATDDLVRRGKRALQDEQNDLLDGLRRQRGKIDTAQVLPGLDEQVARWAHVLQPAVDVAYSGGAGSVDGAAAVGAAPRALLTELSTSVVSPFRERLSKALEQLDARTPADLEIAVAQSLGARYREWRGDQLEGALGDALAIAWSRGVFDAAPDGARLRWVPAVVGKCPDCDDNALEPTVKGSDFPTGQPHPPAHPGCRCLLAVEPD